MPSLGVNLGALILATALLLSGCATGPQFAAGETAVTPKTAAQAIGDYEGKAVVWGGLIVAATNLDNNTRLEVLSYPLNDNQRPDLNAEPQGRFLAMESGYLETLDYAPGRVITVRGTLSGREQGRIGAALYEYPVLQVERIHLWRSGGEGSSRPNVHLGVGVIFGN